jgi:phosphoenolpyruvate carboxykinase (GTP)
MRVLEWILGRCTGSEGAEETAIGNLPRVEDLNTAGLDLPHAKLEALLHVDTEGWSAEYESIGEYLASYGARMPQALLDEHQRISTQLTGAEIEAVGTP